VALQALPAFVIVVINATLLRKICDVEQIGGFEHEGKGIVWNFHRLQFGYARFLKSFSVRSMGSHARVKSSSTRNESLLLGFINTSNESHVLAHAISVIIRRSECVLGDSPSWWENDKISNSYSRLIGRTSQHCEYGGIQVIISDCVDSIEYSQIVFVWGIISMPRHNSKRRVVFFA